MTKPRPINWGEVVLEIDRLFKAKEVHPGWDAIAKRVNIKRTTLQRGLSDFARISTAADLRKWYDGKLNPVGSKTGKLGDLPEGATQVEHDDGGVTLIYKDKRIVTLNQLLNYCKVDRRKWIVGPHELNKWEVGRKDKTVKLVWQDGIVNGTVLDTGKIHVQNLIQVKVKLLPRIIELPTLHVQPISSGPIAGVKPIKSLPASGCAVVISDTQIGFRRNPSTLRLDPFHDRRAMDIALQVIRLLKPQIVIYNGDIMDFSEWSDKFLREPAFYFTTQPALWEAHWWLKQYRMAAPKAKMDYIEGNHDIRPENSIMTHLIAAAGLVSSADINAPKLNVPSLIGLRDLKINYVGKYPHGFVMVNGVEVTHGNVARAQSPDTVKSILQNAIHSTVIGHIHREERASKVLGHRGTDPIHVVCPGCMCRVDYVVPGHTRGQNWTQGFSVLSWASESVPATIETVQIHNGEAIFRGQRIVGKTNEEQITDDIRAAQPGTKIDFRV